MTAKKKKKRSKENPPKPTFSPLTPQDLEEQALWLKQNREQLPQSVVIALENFGALVASLGKSKTKQNELVLQLKRAMGIVPKSERRPSNDTIPGLPNGNTFHKPTQREKLQATVEKKLQLASWHRSLARRHKGKAKMVQEKIDTLPAVEDIVLTPEEEAELAETLRQREERYRYGESEGASPELMSVRETLVSDGPITTGEREENVPAVLPGNRDLHVVKSFTEERVRYDFTVTITRVVAQVEKKVVVDEQGQRTVISGDTWALGPPHYGVTWSFLTNLAIMVGQYAMPLNRLAKLLATEGKPQSASSLWKMLRYVAERFVPIYVELFEALSDSLILMGDDTTTRVLEVHRAIARADREETEGAKEAEPTFPWHAYRNPTAAQETLRNTSSPSLGALIAAHLGFEFPRKNGTGAKRALNTTVVSGRQDALDPHSLVVFYRSHIGNFGNLLDMLLQQRKPSAKEVIIQSDLATFNLIGDPAIKTAFDIRYIGCTSHARRPFALYEHEDPALCSYMLHLFKGFAIDEWGLDVHGRNFKNVTAIRGVDSREMWEDIKALANQIAEKWSKESKLGQGARYILRHYDKLTAYLDDPRLEPTNNFSERMLRMEKLIEDSSMFRVSLEGRFVLDILRTVMQTAIVAGAPLQEYILHVLQTRPEEVAQSPEQFVPRTWVKTYLPSDDDIRDGGSPSL